jgi:hypothetical protein
MRYQDFKTLHNSSAADLAIAVKQELWAGWLLYGDPWITDSGNHLQAVALPGRQVFLSGSDFVIKADNPVSTDQFQTVIFVRPVPTPPQGHWEVWQKGQRERSSLKPTEYWLGKINDGLYQQLDYFPN